MWGSFFVFILCFFATAGLLGMIMYGLICLSDLESDFINPHDASQTLTTWAWLPMALMLPMLIFNVRLYLRGDFRVHATDIFQNVTNEKKIRLGKLVYTIVFFILIIYKLIALTVHSLSDEHREIAKSFFDDATNFT